MYIMVYLLNKNYLPWSDFNTKFKEYEFKDFLRERLELKYTKEVFRLIPRDLRDMFKRVFTLTFEEEPPYEYIINSIREEIEKEQMQDHVFEWTDTMANRLKAKFMKENIDFERNELFDNI
jgi:hypothetical protein